MEEALQDRQCFCCAPLQCGTSQPSELWIWKGEQEISPGQGGGVGGGEDNTADNLQLEGHLPGSLPTMAPRALWNKISIYRAFPCAMLRWGFWRQRGFCMKNLVPEPAEGAITLCSVLWTNGTQNPCVTWPSHTCRYGKSPPCQCLLEKREWHCNKDTH